MSNLDDFWGTPEEKPKPETVKESDVSIDIASPCPICFRSDNTISTKGPDIDKINVFCKHCNLGYTFSHKGIWQMLGIYE